MRGKFQLPLNWHPRKDGFKRINVKAIRENPTPFLFVANCVRSADAWDEEIVRAVFGEFGSVNGIYFKSKFVNVAYEDEGCAERARAALNGRAVPEFNNRVIRIDYSLPRAPKKTIPIPEDMVSATAHIPNPPGLILIENFITEEEEKILVEKLDGEEWIKDLSRRVQHYGYEFDYTTRSIDPSRRLGDLPHWLRAPLANGVSSAEEQWKDFLIDISKNADQVTVNEYLSGQGIRPHVDNPTSFTELIVALSLLSPAMMDFRHPDDRKKCILLPPRSLLVLSGDSRYIWSHGIGYRKTEWVDGEVQLRKRRVSITYRVVRPDAIPQQQSWESKVPTAVEKEFVHDFYDASAQHFSDTRHTPWPQVQAFVEQLPLGSLLVDLGCGNGKYLKVLPRGVYGSGLDRCEKLCQITRERNCQVLIGDALCVPYRDQCADVVLSVAVLHHFSSLYHRKLAIAECVRVLKNGGKGLICAWAKEQKGSKCKRTFKNSDVYVPWNLAKKFLKDTPQEVLDSGEVDDEYGNLILQRYCHVYEEGELEALIRDHGGVEILRTFWDTGNWCVEFRRHSK